MAESEVQRITEIGTEKEIKVPTASTKKNSICKSSCIIKF